MVKELEREVAALTRLIQAAERESENNCPLCGRVRDPYPEEPKLSGGPRVVFPEAGDRRPETGDREDWALPPRDRSPFDRARP